MGINLQELFTELCVCNQDTTRLTEVVNRATVSLVKAQEKLDAATLELQLAEQQPDFVQEATELVRKMEDLGCNELIIRSAIRSKYGSKRATTQDTGSPLTEDLKVQALEFVHSSGMKGFTTRQLSEKFDVKRAHVALWLRELVSNKTVEKYGVKRATRYFLYGNVPGEEVEEVEEQDGFN